MRLDLIVGGGTRPTHHQLDLQAIDGPGLAPGKVRFTLDGEAAEADWAEVAPGIYSIIIGGRSYEVFISPQPEQNPSGHATNLVTVHRPHHPLTKSVWARRTP